MNSLSTAGEPVLKCCPFCGEQPAFSEHYTIADRRYVRMNLECCVSMTDDIPWEKYRGLPEEQVAAQLKESLAASWNGRASHAEGPAVNDASLLDWLEQQPTIEIKRWLCGEKLTIGLHSCDRTKIAEGATLREAIVAARMCE